MPANRSTWLVRNVTALVAIASVVAYIAFIQWAWGWEKIFLLWREVGLGHVLAATAMLLCTYVLRTWRISDYFPEETRGHFGLLLRLVQVHNLLNVMMPFRSGEVSFPLLMKREFGLPVARGTSALLVMRLLDLHALLAAAGIGLVLERHNIYLWFVWAAFSLLPAVAFSMRRPLFQLARRFAPARLENVLTGLEAGLPAHAPAFVRAWLVTLLNWLVKVTVLAWALVLLGALDLGPAFGGALGGELSSVLPLHAPGGVGTYPAGITAGALAFGASSDADSLASLGKAAVNGHLLIIVTSVIGTLLSMVVASRTNRPVVRSVSEDSPT